MVGQRLELLWDADKKWFPGKLLGFDGSDKHLILYDDGDWEWLTLHQEKYRWLGVTTAAQTTATAARTGAGDRSGLSLSMSGTSHPLLLYLYALEVLDAITEKGEKGEKREEEEEEAMTQEEDVDSDHLPDGTSGTRNNASAGGGGGRSGGGWGNSIVGQSVQIRYTVDAGKAGGTFAYERGRVLACRLSSSRVCTRPVPDTMACPLPNGSAQEGGGGGVQSDAAKEAENGEQKLWRQQHKWEHLLEFELKCSSNGSAGRGAKSKTAKTAKERRWVCIGDHRCLISDRLVWAKCQGSPWWPAHVHRLSFKERQAYWKDASKAGHEFVMFFQEVSRLVL
jgi:hypothetical protein